MDWVLDNYWICWIHFLLTEFVTFGTEAYGTVPVAVVDSSCLRLKGFFHEKLTEPYFKDTVEFSKVTFFNESTRVQLSQNFIDFHRNDRYYCKVGFSAREPGYRILLSWEYFLIGENKNGEDWLQVADMQSGLPLSSEMWGGSDKISNNPPSTHDYRSIGHGLTIHYKGHPYEDYFSLVLTVFKGLNDKNACDDKHFECKGLKPICISDNLKCNGEENCGELHASDEEGQCEKAPWIRKKVHRVSKHSTPIGLIGALLGIVVTGFSVASVACLIFWYKRKRRRRQNGGVQYVRSIASLADEINREPASSNTYIHLPVHSTKRNPLESQENSYITNSTMRITSDGDSSEVLLPAFSADAPRDTDWRFSTSASMPEPRNGQPANTHPAALPNISAELDFDPYAAGSIVDSEPIYQQLS